MNNRIRKYLTLLTITVLLLATCPGAFAQAPIEVEPENEITNGGWEFRRSWGGEGDAMYYPRGVAVSKDGRLYVANSGLSRILIIDKDDSIKTFGGPGTNAGQFSWPEGIAIAPNNTIYIVDTYNYRIQQFDMEGNFIRMWGQRGPEPGNFGLPMDIAIDDQGFLYITEWNNDRVQKFTPEGQFVKSWGSTGDQPGQFSQPEGICVDKNRFVYVVDSLNHRVQKFDREGNFLLEWGEKGTWEGNQLFFPDAISVDSDGNIVVADIHIRVFTPNGEFVRFIIRTPGLPAPYFTALDHDSSGRLYVAIDNYHGINLYDKDDKYLRDWGFQPFEGGRFGRPVAVTTDLYGNILIADATNSQVHVFSPGGAYLQSFGEYGTEDDQFQYPYGLAINSRGDIFIADSENDRIMVFSKDFNHLYNIGSEGTQDGQWTGLNDVAIDKFDNVYGIEGHDEYRVQKFNGSGQFLKKWSIFDGHWTPVSIAIHDNEVYVFAGLVKVYDLEGNFLRSFQGGGGYFRGLETDPLGNLYASNTSNQEIISMDKFGSIRFRFGSNGSGAGEFNNALDVEFHTTNQLFVADTGNLRMQVFSQGLPAPDSYSGLVQNGSFERNPSLTEWTYGGEQPVTHVHNATHGQRSLLLGRAVAERVPQGQNKAFAYSNFYVDPNIVRPVLTFDYNMFVNDTKDYSDFFVEVQDGVGLNHLATVVHDGFSPCIPGRAPSPGRNLGWRSAHLDLTPYKGQHIRIVFSNRNRWPGAWGMWTYVDNVRVLDHGYLPQPPGPYRLRMPVILANRCDPVGKGSDEIYRQLPLAE